MVILSLCGDKYNKPSDKLEDLTLLDRAWKRAVARFSQDNNARRTGSPAGGVRPPRPDRPLLISCRWRRSGKESIAAGPSQVASEPPHSIPARNITVAMTS